MSLPLAQSALVHIAKALEPLTQFYGSYLGNKWAFTPGYAVFFIQVFVFAILWIRYVGIDRKKAPFLASCAMSTIHAILCVLAGFHELKNWHTGPLHLDVPNTPIQNLQLQFSLGYLLADTLYYILFDPNDFIFLAHHFLAGAYLACSLHLGLGGISAIFVFFMGEVTSPLFNVFNVAKELKHEHARAARVLELTSPLFTFSFVLVRSIISPVLIGWFLYALWYDSPGIPALYRGSMCAFVTIGLAGSQLWSYKLIKGFKKARRAGSKKTAAKEE